MFDFEALNLLRMVNLIRLLPNVKIDSSRTKASSP